MQYVLLATSGPLTHEFLTGLSADWAVSDWLGYPGGYWISLGPDQFRAVRIELDPGGLTEYRQISDWEVEDSDDERDREGQASAQIMLSKLESLKPDAVLYFVHFKDEDCLKRVLMAIAENQTCVIDDDYRLVVSGAEFLALCRANSKGNAWWLGGDYP